MYRCSCCGEIFQKGNTSNLKMKIKDNNLARAALFFNDKMQSYKKTHPAHICTYNRKTGSVLQCGIGEFAGFKIYED